MSTQPAFGNIVKGMVFPPFVTEEYVEGLKNFQLRPDDVFVVTYPKSGTTWTQQIIKLIRNEGREDEVKISQAVPWIEGNSKLLQWVDLEKMPSPRAFKCHLPYSMMPGGLPHTTQAKYIYVARNPKDTAVSLYQFICNSGFPHFLGSYTETWNEFISRYMDGKVWCGLWFDRVLEWWKHKDEANVLFLKYEDMKSNLSDAVKTISEFMGYNLRSQVIDLIAQQCTFQGMKTNPVANYTWWDQRPDEATFMRKGIVGDWKSHFTTTQCADIDALYTERMQGTGLDFDFGD